MAPEHLELLQAVACTGDLIRVGANEAFATRGGLVDQTCLVEHGNVLLHGGEGHVVVGREPADREVAQKGPPYDVSPRRIRECAKDPVQPVVC